MIWRRIARATPIWGLLLVCSVTWGHNTLSPSEADAGWRLLFDGVSTHGWRGYRKTGTPEGWRAVDGELRRTAQGGDLVTVDEFRNFELQLEWKVEAGGNSGLFLRAGESDPHIFMSAPEAQILDDDGHRDGASPLTSAGSNYALHPVPRGVVHPAGQWNHMRVRMAGDEVTHWLNGQRVVDYRLGSDDWRARVAASKFAQWPAYGTLPGGHIGLQDHGDRVAFRNIKIRVLNED